MVGASACGANPPVDLPDRARRGGAFREAYAGFPFIGAYFDLDLTTGALRRRDKMPSEVRGVARQYLHFRLSFLGDVLFFQVGKFAEFYRPGDVLVATTLGLQRMVQNRRGARYGFPLEHTEHHLLNLLARGRSVTLIMESGRLLEGVKERLPRYRCESRASMPLSHRNGNVCQQ